MRRRVLGRNGECNTYLLTKADTRAGIEGEEDERVLGEVFLEAVIQEAVGIKFLS
jgi:hypothetical protein